MSALPSKYNEARRALAEAKAVDEVKEIRDQAEAMRIYGQRAKDRGLEIDAAEIRMRAERRLGEMIIAQKKTVGLAKGGAEKGVGRRGADNAVPQENRIPTLAEVGIDKKLSMRAQKMAAVPEDSFNELMRGWRANVEAESERVTVDLLRHGREEQQRQSRRDLAEALSEKSAELSPVGRKYPCIYADPAWRRKAGEGNRSYENHYRTMDWDAIMALPVKDRLLPDAWVFLWIPRAHLFSLHDVLTEVRLEGGAAATAWVKMPLAWAIAKAWGCDSYSTCFVWTKTDDDHPNEQGTGLVVRDQDEILCLFKRGRGLPKPKSDEKFGSNHRERSKPLGHSRKPEHYRRMIASMTGGLPVLEMFARIDDAHPLPPNWDGWGDQGAFECVRQPEPALQQQVAPGIIKGIEIIDAPAPDRPAGSNDDGLDIPDFLRRRKDPA
jgi:N6-adenosine-specific RNA methylase IME4